MTDSSSFADSDNVLPASTAIVSDSLGTPASARPTERIIDILHYVFPQAPIFTTVYNPELVPARYRSWDIRPSFVQRLPLAKTRDSLYRALLPMAVEGLDLSGYDLVISANIDVAKGATTHAEALHICYCHSPIGLASEQRADDRGHNGFSLSSKALPLLIHYFTLWDIVAAQRVDRFVCVSQTVAKRIAKRYRRRATVIYPPVNTRFFQPQNLDREDFFLLVTAKGTERREDIAIDAFNKLRLPLWVVGDGRQRALERQARDNIHFIGRISESVLRECYARCRALIVPNQEDCGLLPLEAQAMGTPVIAYAAGAARETVIEGVTGAFFFPQTPEDLADAVRSFEPEMYDPERIRAHACQYDFSAFRDEFVRFASRAYRLHRRRWQSELC